MMPHRVKILDHAAMLTGADRNKAYGEPSRNLSDCAELWATYLATKYSGKLPGYANMQSEFRLSSEDVAWLNVLQKIARSFASYKEDNYIDAAAYAAIAGECAFLEAPADDE